jgi:hypothetical protein
VIPQEWTPVRRESDGELVGYLAPDAVDATLVVPMTLVGSAFGPADTAPRASAALREGGLAALAARWWCRLPKTLPENPIEVTTAKIGWVWRPVLVIEVGTERCSVRPAFAYPDEFKRSAYLAVPVGAKLRSTPEQ